MLEKKTVPRRGARVVGPLLSVLVILLAGGGATWWYLVMADRDATPSLTSVSVQRGNIEDVVTATGTLQPRDYVDVGAQVSGQLHRIHVEVGSEVAEGELLAEIDPTLFMAKVDASRAQLRYQRAQLQEREAQLTLAEIQYRRQQNLHAEDATTVEALQNAEASLRSARAQIEMLEAQIEQTESSLRADEANLGYAQIYAPMAGTVVSISARQGQTINASQQAPTILRIADLSIMTVETQVSEADVGRLRVGMDAWFTTLGNTQRRWQGQLRRVEPTPAVENNVVLYNALFEVENPAARRDSKRELLPQMTAQVFFVIAAAQDTLLVPTAALSWQVTVGEQDQRVEGAARGPREGMAREGGPREGGMRRERGEARGDGGVATGQPRRANLEVLAKDGVRSQREVSVGVSTRVQSQILSGVEEGEQVVVPLQANRSRNTQAAARTAGPAGAGVPRLH